LYGDGLIAVGSSKGEWFEVLLDGTYRSIHNSPLGATTRYGQSTFVKLSDSLGVAVEASSDTKRAFIYFHMGYQSPHWYNVEVYELHESAVKVSLSGSSALEPKLAIQAAEALKLGATIAQDFENFINNPHKWIYTQCKLPQPFDAVLSLPK
jgi:hypothetical protein